MGADRQVSNLAAGVTLGPAVFDEAADSTEPIFPADFLALGVAAPRVGDADLVNSSTGLRDLDRYFGLKPESIFLDLY